MPSRALGSTGSAWGGQNEIDDVAFTRALIEHVSGVGCVETAREMFEHHTL
jgi:poly(3-hydroxybutyrate) depolymerase